MQYINKESDREAGNKITEAYLHEIWIEDEQRYPVDYNDSFKKLPNKANSYYKQMTQVLLNNQNHYCCYCMRRLTGEGDTTLEHIIPQTADDKDALYYQRDEFPMLKKNIKLSVLFSHEHNPDLDQLPHSVCYDNLVASCHVKFPTTKHGGDIETDGHSCNHPRGAKCALPLYFLEEINTIITYEINGSILANPDSPWCEEAKELIQSAQLTWETLSDIRALWYVLRDIDINQIIAEGKNEQSRMDLIQDNLYLTEYSEKRINALIAKFTKKQYWECFLLYDWFHSYHWNAA